MLKNSLLPSLRKWLLDSRVGPILEPIYFGQRYLRVYQPWLSDRQAVERKFRERFGYLPDLDDPKTFNEKIQWLKLHDRDHRKVICADKFLSRNFVTEHAGPQYAIPCLMVTDNPNDITPENLPDEPCVIKTNHDQGTVFLIHDKSKVDFRLIRNRLRIALKSNLYHDSREWVYDQIERKIVAEPLLVSDDGNDLKDYKFYCFGGEPKYIQTDSDRFSTHKRNMYTSSWEPVEVSYGYPTGEIEPKPVLLSDMLEVARKVSKVFCFARVDLYISNGQPYVGEITFFPAGGLKKFSPDSFDRELGDMIKLPVKE